MKEIIVKFLKTCKFNIENGNVFFSTTLENYTKFQEENGVDFYQVWDLYDGAEQDRIMQMCFM